MQLKKTIDWESKAFPGITAKLRVLSVVQRSKRDARIAVARAEVTRLYVERRHLLKSLVGEGDETERKAAFEKLDLEQEAKLESMIQQIRRIEYGEIAPEVIRTAVISVSGFDVDGQPGTVEDLIESAPEALLIELYDACERASGLTGAERKN